MVFFLYMWRGMVEKWRAIAFKYFCNKDLMAGWGRIIHGKKKDLFSILEATNFYVKQWNDNYQGLTKNPD